MVVKGSIRQRLLPVDGGYGAGWLAGWLGWLGERARETRKYGNRPTSATAAHLFLDLIIALLPRYGRVQVVVQAREVGRPGLGLEVAQRPLHVLRSTDLLCCY